LSLREKLASLEHDQWIEWSKTLAQKETLSQDRLNRWSKLWIPYDQLTEEQKDADRVWADKILRLIHKDLPCRWRVKAKDSGFGFRDLPDDALVCEVKKQLCKDVPEELCAFGSEGL